MVMNMKYKHLFGPVPSRRLGVSLGVDLVPHKVCSMNCIYCEVGKTTTLTIKRGDYIPLKDLMKELSEYLANEPELDYITFSGAGEPLLHSGIGEIIHYIKTEYPQYKLALITNSTMLCEKKVRNEIKDIDLILPSLDAASELAFRKINRTHPKVKLSEIINGLIEFKKLFSGEMWLEVFLSPGINDTQEELANLKEAIMKISPDQVQLNTLDRPGTQTGLEPISEERMAEIAEFFRPLPVTVIAKFKSRNKLSSFDVNVESVILETISRRPCTAKDLSEMLGLHINEVNKYISTLLKDDKIVAEEQRRGVFFCAK